MLLPLPPLPSLPSAASPLLVAAVAPTQLQLPLCSLAAAQPNGGVGPQPEDAIFFVVFVAVIAFAVRQVYDATFPENQEYIPPVPGKVTLPFGLGGSGKDPMVEAEELRAKLAQCIEARDMEGAFRTEKALKQLMGENGLFYEPDGFQQPEPEFLAPDAPGTIENDL